MKFLLDTCVVSEFIKARPNKKVIAWVKENNEENFYLSTLTFGEIHKGIEKINDIKRKKKLYLWVENDLKERFDNKVLSIDVKVATIWGQVQAKPELDGTPMPAIDGLIASTGLAHNLIVVTRNTSDMEPSGVVLFNPWKT